MPNLPVTPACRAIAVACLATLLALAAQAAEVVAPNARTAASLPPPDVVQLLQRERIPLDALSVVVQDAGGATPRLSLNARQLRNPASLAKLITTYAALDQLGPAFTWATPVWLAGGVRDGVLEGALHLQGRGDPKLVLERVWLLLDRLRRMGVNEIRGDIVLDQSAFAVPETSTAEFDNEPLRPYNVRAEALMLGQNTVIYTFTPDTARGWATVTAEPALAGVQSDTRVALTAGPCDDWRAALKATHADPLRVRFAGAYPGSCGERVWAVAYPDPRAYPARLLEGLWRGMGGRFGGTVREGPAPAGVKPSFELVSPPLADVVRDINKFSNNVMAQQLFLTLALQRDGVRATPEAARELMRQWLTQRLGEVAQDVVLENGSGLSRDTRTSAALLAQLLQSAWASPVMPELMASLPVNGLDGTLRRSRAAAGRAHLKTGSLRDAYGVAGYVLGDSGQRYVLVALVNHPNANAARPALDALVQWTIDDAPRSRRPAEPSQSHRQ